MGGEGGIEVEREGGRKAGREGGRKGGEETGSAGMVGRSDEGKGLVVKGVK